MQLLDNVGGHTKSFVVQIELNAPCNFGLFKCFSKESQRPD